MSDERLDRAFRALRDSAADLAAPARVERTVLAEFRRRKAAERRRAAAWSGLAAAAAVVAALLLVRQAPQPAPAPAAQAPPAAVSAFIPVAPWREEDGARVIRMHVPAAALAAYGLPVNEERLSEKVPADVLVADDGTARAIRLVRYQ